MLSGAGTGERAGAKGFKSWVGCPARPGPVVHWGCPLGAVALRLLWEVMFKVHIRITSATCNNICRPDTDTQRGTGYSASTSSKMK